LFQIDRVFAEKSLARLPLNDRTRRFADWWLSRIAADGRPLTLGSGTALPADLAASTMLFEVWPWSSVICRASGDDINRVIGFDVTGRDVLGLVPQSRKPERLSRFQKVVAGGLRISRRAVVTADGARYSLQEILAPHPDRSIAPVEPDAMMAIAFVDASDLPPDKHVLISRRAADIPTDSTFVDLRPEAVRLCA
jgi:hypothetical protein